MPRSQNKSWKVAGHRGLIIIQFLLEVLMLKKGKNAVNVGDFKGNSIFFFYPIQSETLSHSE